MGGAVLSGIVEAVGRSSTSGWVRIEASWLERHGPPTIELRRDREVVSFGAFGPARRDLTGDGFVGHSFKIELSPEHQSEFLSGHLRVVCSSAGEVVELGRVASLDLAMRVNATSSDGLAACGRLLTPRSREVLSKLPTKGALPIGIRRQAAVITYANDAGAWFPYFVSYYGRLFGVENIFVVTPMPEAFEGFGLGGVWSVKGFPYDDGARANIMSSIANGCRNYYVWSIVCDVDEIIEPAQRLNMNLSEYLSSCEDSVVYTRGLDVIQTEDEREFDFGLRVVDQRSLSIPNAALSKPHAARVDIAYSGGYHFCSRLPEAASLRGDLVTYHLKWACSKIRSEVQASVLSTLYSESSIESYSLASVDPEGQHPSLTRSGTKVVDCEDDTWIAFCSESLAALQWEPERALYIGNLTAAPFMVRLR